MSNEHLTHSAHSGIQNVKDVGQERMDNAILGLGRVIGVKSPNSFKAGWYNFVVYFLGGGRRGNFAIFSFYRTQVSLGSDLWVLMSVSTRGFADLTDVTLADEDSNSIPTDDVSGQSMAMRKCKWRHLVAKIETNASGTTWWPN